jgi:phenylpropionate dioxygenase-like ring-hydroxylating dioxygenase large terminal subunit
LMCPLHGWAFDPRTGACVTRPEQPVKSYTVAVRDGRVWIEMDVPNAAIPVVNGFGEPGPASDS